MSDATADHSKHILPLKVYLGVGFALLILTVITVAVSFFDFGPGNLVVAMTVAAIKASLVALYFMHLKYDNKLYLVVFLLSILFLATFIVITMFDTLRRDDVYELKSQPIESSAGIYNTPVTDSAAVLDSSVIETDTTDTTGDH